MRKYSKKQIAEAIAYWQRVLRAMDLINESKSQLLDVCEKEFGKDIAFSTTMNFQLTKQSADKIFNILDSVIFDNYFKTLKNLVLKIDVVSALNSYAKAHLGMGKDFDISNAYAMYIPYIKNQVALNKLGKRMLVLNKLGDCIMINISDSSKMVFSYALLVICHEMIHCYDCNAGQLLQMTQYYLNNGVSMADIDGASHFTNVFEKFSTIMKNKHKLTIPLSGNDMSFEELNQKIADEVKTISESTLVEDFDDEDEEFIRSIGLFSEKNKDYIVPGRNGTFIIKFYTPSLGF